MTSSALGALQEPTRHILVLDCNIYLDIARTLGPPFDWERFDEAAAKMARTSPPHPDGHHMESLRLVAMCTSGRFAGDETIEVWTNDHINRVVRYKAMEPTKPHPQTRSAGLGWSAEDAETLVTSLIGDLTSWSSGGTLGATVPNSTPPLDHEDGMVYGACKLLAGTDPLAEVYCATRDRDFLNASANGKLEGCSRVMTPAILTAAIRQARIKASMRAMGLRS